jgi:CheY-like chemotaxis protein
MQQATRWAQRGEIMNKKFVLHIEDNFHNRRIVKKVLESRGYEVFEAEDGVSGLNMIRELKPSVVLLDISLPEMDGTQIAAQVKTEADLRATSLIALTASAMRGDRERFLEAGCDDYLSKPIQALELIDLVAKYYPVTD